MPSWALFSGLLSRLDRMVPEEEMDAENTVGMGRVLVKGRAMQTEGLEAFNPEVNHEQV